MKSLLMILILLLSQIIVVTAQQKVSDSFLSQIRQIKLLDSDRHDVRRILYNFTATDDDNHYQEFSNDEVDIEVTYATGSCSDEADYEGASELWQVREWKVTKVEITFNDTMKIEDFGYDFYKFRKESRFADEPGATIFHDKGLGLAFETDEDGIEGIILFPESGNRKKLCKAVTIAKDFYARKAWHEGEPPNRNIICSNGNANVVDVDLTLTEVSATTGKVISVSTTAVDPENDVLTYTYVVSGGMIRGQGARVLWDLIGVKAGTYTLTVGVDDGAGIVGQTITKSVVVK